MCMSEISSYLMETLYVSATEPNQLIPFRETFPVKYKHTLWVGKYRVVVS
jgi:hypothetical protein